MENYAQPTIIANPDSTVIYVGCKQSTNKERINRKIKPDCELRCEIQIRHLSNFKFLI